MSDLNARSRPGASSTVTKGFDLLFELLKHELTIRDIARILDCSERNAFRYIRNIDLASPDGRLIERVGGRYRIPRAQTLVELSSGGFDEGLMAAMLSTPLGSLVKTKGGLPQKALEKVRALVDARYAQSDDSGLPSLFKAMLAGRHIAFDYDSGSGPKEHVAVPIRLYLDPVQLYLVAYDEAYGHLICLATTKIANLRADPPGVARMPATRFTELGDYCRSAWGKMIRHDAGAFAQASFEASPAVAPYFRKNKLRLDQTMIDLPDGSLRVGLRIHNPTEFVRFLLRFGESVRILGDEETLAEAKRFIAAMRAFYA